MIKQEKIDIEDTNVANIGSDADKAARKGAALTEEQWVGAGKKPGIQVWRVENHKGGNFGVNRWPEDQYGKFFSGDSYIVLYTYQARDPETGQLTDKLLYDVHFWLGAETSQDEAGVAAYKTVELDDLLDGLPIQYREVMGCESSKFNRLFKSIEIMEGGIDSGFNHVEAASYTARLLHIKGKENVRVMQVPLKLESLNAGDVFILDTGLELWQWNGRNSSHHERKAANETIANIKTQRGSKPTSVILDDLEDDEKFWKYFGGKPESVAPATSDEGITRATALWRLKTVKGKLTFKQVAKGDIDQKHLNSTDVFILDVGFQLYVWVGKLADKEEKKKAMIYATDYLKDKNYSVTTPIVRVVEGMICPEFDMEFSKVGYSRVTEGDEKEEKVAAKKVLGPPLGCVAVSVTEAKDLYDSQLLGKQDPFCKVLVGKKSFKTETHENGNKEAKWNAPEFKFELREGADELVFEVFNDNVLKNARIGDFAIPFSTLSTHTSPTSAWYQLTRKGSEPAGQIFVTTQFHKPMTITAHEARGIRSVQLIGKQDPFVNFKAGKNKYTTAYHNNGGKTPSWRHDNKFTFNAFMLDPEHKMSVQLKDKNPRLMWNKEIAWTEIPLKTLINGQKDTAIWFPLQKSAKNAKTAGEISMTVSF
mmetsp:Transcript_474/g.660  ORF Transcript_474/g.660 Transcript_474/m.660 type:complete len:649 (-) Transcript_474:273-2219(-)|eukprot:CAMPEP_0175095948 /NCGR_PEP_ID=MMETSP0086_2-20121207/4452_1 /TAXON_ID=136419 /ORGANISM="Unknown Unknown, Strain D1" /LENGTH=648 /DNA_ID=CAMNT_0016369279 /DNA_START=27 /DNA_END=1973 /DNA_ORIENTATION=+